MTDYTKLMDEFPEINPANYGDDEVNALNAWGIAAHTAIEALQAECAELQSANDQLNDDCAMHMRVAVDAIDAKVVLMAERDALQAKLNMARIAVPVLSATSRSRHHDTRADK